MRDVRNFLLAYTTRPFEWGQDDCSLFLADWWRYNHHADPAAHLRGAYHDKAGKDAVLARAGGLLAVVDRMARDVGARRTREYEAGDFGLIRTGRWTEPVGAICTGQFWAVRNEQVGFVVTPRVLRAWKID